MRLAMRDWLSTRLLLALAIMMMLSTTGYADPFRLRLEDLSSGQGVVITDNGAGDSSSTAGVIVFTGSLGAFPVIVTTGMSAPLVGGPGGGTLQLNSISISMSGNSSMRLSLEDGNYDSTPNGSRVVTAETAGVLTAPAGSTI